MLYFYFLKTSDIQFVNQYWALYFYLSDSNLKVWYSDLFSNLGGLQNDKSVDGKWSWYKGLLHAVQKCKWSRLDILEWSCKLAAVKVIQNLNSRLVLFSVESGVQVFIIQIPIGNLFPYKSFNQIIIAKWYERLFLGIFY